MNRLSLKNTAISAAAVMAIAAGIWYSKITTRREMSVSGGRAQMIAVVAPAPTSVATPIPISTPTLSPSMESSALPSATLSPIQKKSPAVAVKKEAINDTDAFAKCLNERGAKFYGASWCPHCQAQKSAFGTSQKLLPYIECATSDGGQTDVCNEAGIRAYPTWRFADGSEQLGEVAFADLAKKAGCIAPPLTL